MIKLPATWTASKLKAAVRGLFWGGLSLFLLLVTLVAMLLMYATGNHQPNPVASPTPSMFYTVATKKNTERSWWVEPAVIELADSAKATGEERERSLGERLSRVADKAPEPISVDQSTGITAVKSGSEFLATVLPEDLPEFAAHLKDESRKSLEREIADHWAYSIGDDLELRRWRKSPEYGQGLMILYLLQLLVCLSAHRALNVWGREFLDSPVWGAKALVWSSFILCALYLLPGGESLGYVFGKGVAGPLFTLLVLGLVATTIQHLGSFAIRRYFVSLARTHRYQNQPRAHSRFITLRHSMEFGLRLMLSMLVFLSILSALEVNLAALATGAGLLGATITFVCQDTIRDFLAGLNILLEDQYVLGDWIEGAGASGQVEAFTLRSTQVRCSDGSLMYIPNSELRKVRNETRDWSQVDFRLLISNRQALGPAMAALQMELNRLAEECAESLLSDPVLLGAENIGSAGCCLRATLKTRPGDQWKVNRQLNRRVKERFEQDGIQLAVPLWDR